MQLLKNKDIKVLKWPVTSPGLNPIENLMDHIDKPLQKMKPTSLKQLEEMIQDVWFNITCLQCHVDLLNVSEVPVIVLVNINSSS